MIWAIAMRSSVFPSSQSNISIVFRQLVSTVLIQMLANSKKSTRMWPVIQHELSLTISSLTMSVIICKKMYSMSVLAQTDMQFFGDLTSQIKDKIVSLFVQAWADTITDSISDRVLQFHFRLLLIELFGAWITCVHCLRSFTSPKVSAAALTGFDQTKQVCLYTQVDGMMLHHSLDPAPPSPSADVSQAEAQPCNQSNRQKQTLNITPLSFKSTSHKYLLHWPLMSALIQWSVKPSALFSEMCIFAPTSPLSQCVEASFAAVNQVC